MDKFQWNAITTTNTLESAKEGWSIPLKRKFGHVFLEWTVQFLIRYPRQQLQNMHLHFMHPSTDKLMSLLERAYPDNIKDDTKRLLTDISKACHACQVYSARPLSFKVRFPDSVVFNKRIALDLMYLSGDPVLHIVDIGTNFSAARFLSGEDAKTIWNTFLYTWVSIYRGFRNEVLSDQGSVFTSKEWEARCAETEISVESTGTESHNSLGKGETYHALLRRVYNKVKLTHPQLPKELVLALSVKALNDTAGPNGLVPSLLLFGVMPRIPTEPATYPDTNARIQAMESPRDELEVINARARVQQSLKKSPPPAASLTLSPMQPVYVYREKDKRWTGPHLITSVDGKRVMVDLGERTGPRKFNLSQVKPDRLPSITALLPPQTGLPSPSASIPPLTSLLHPNNTSARTFYTEIITPHDPRSGLFDEAKRNELEALIKRGTFKMVLRSELENNPNIVPSRFVLAIKHKETGEEIYKARFVLGGHRDREKHSVVHNATTLKQSSIRLLLALATIFGFNLWSTDFNQAYLQSASNLRRRIFVRPDILELDDDTLLQIVKPLYGLSDAGDYWGETLTEHHTKELDMEQTTGDSRYFSRKSLTNSLAYQAHMLTTFYELETHNSRKMPQTKGTNNAFETKPIERLPMSYTGMRLSEVSQNNALTRKLDQKSYIDNLKLMPKGCSYEDFRSMRAKLAWVVNSRPDIACAVSFASQVTRSTFNDQSHKLLNRIVKHLRATKNVCLQYPQLQLSTLQITAYSDASFKNNVDNTSQLGYIIFLTDASGKCCVISFSSHKSRRVTRSSMAGETIALAEAFDLSFILKHDLQRMLGREIPLLLFTDSKLLFDVITGNRYTTEARLMVDVASVREAYNQKIISNIALIKKEHNVADALTKIKPNDALLQVLSAHKLIHPIQQYVVDNRLLHSS